MPLYAITMTHSATACPMFNQEIREKSKPGFLKREEIAKKHRINVLVSCGASLEHLILYVVEAPAQAAVEAYLMELGWVYFSNIQIREVQSTEVAFKRLESMY